MRFVKYILLSLVVVMTVFTAGEFGYHPSRICKLRPRLTISTVTKGIFSWWIPQSGMLKLDSTTGRTFLDVEVDQLYVRLVNNGTRGFTTRRDITSVKKIRNISKS